MTAFHTIATYKRLSKLIDNVVSAQSTVDGETRVHLDRALASLYDARATLGFADDAHVCGSCGEITTPGSCVREC